MIQTVTKKKILPKEDSQGVPYTVGNRATRRYSFRAAQWKEDKSKQVHMSRDVIAAMFQMTAKMAAEAKKLPAA